MSKSTKEQWNDWARRHPDERRAHRQRWEQSEKGKAWLKANQARRQAALQKWREKKQMEKYGSIKKGAGRRPMASEEKAVTVSVTLPPAVLERIDRERGAMSRGKWIASRL